MNWLMWYYGERSFEFFVREKWKNEFDFFGRNEGKGCQTHPLTLFFTCELKFSLNKWGPIREIFNWK